MATATHLLNIVIRVIDQATAPLKATEDNLKKIDKAATGMSGKMLGVGLGLTFFMFGVKMQLDRMLRSMFNIFQQAEGETGALNQQFNIVRVHLAAISIAFFDAFAQSGLFDFIVNAVMNIADWFLNLSDSTREWLSSSLFVFSGLILGLSLIGQALLALYVLSQINPIVLAISAIAIAIGGLAIYFATQKDEIASDWENLLNTFKEEVDLSFFDKVNLAITNLQIFLLDALPVITTVMGAIWGAIVGGLPGAAIGAGVGALLGVGIREQLRPGLVNIRDELLGKFPIDTRGAVGVMEVPEVASAEDLLNMIDQQAAAFDISMKENLTNIPIMVKPSENPLKIENTEMFDYLSEQDRQKLEKIEGTTKEIGNYRTDFETRMNDLISAVNAIEVKPVVNVVIQGGSSTTS